MEEIVCQGCGVSIQSERPNEAGFAPASALEKETIICKRCFRLKHYNEVQDVSYTDDDFLTMISQIRNTKGLIVKIVDIFDFNGSFISSLQRLTGNNPVLLVGNKVDLLPKSTNKSKLIQWMKKSASDLGVKVQDVYLISAAKGIGMDQLEAAIADYRAGRDVYVVGSTNVGKSTFINRLIDRSTGVNDAITTSYFPGTTLGFIDIPLDEQSSLYDTPGVINRGQMAHYLSDQDLKVITPNKEIKPRVYQLNEKQTLYIGGLARFDFEKGDKQSFVCYFANQLSIHRTKLENAEQLYEKHVGEMLSPPNEETLKSLPALNGKSMRIEDSKVDIVFPGLGWITIPNGGVTITAFSPKGVPVSIRTSLI
ncbi:ribosome biogenesis GTPase YqeH [Aquibacillus koreensis]|uniref:Ribosome biogenesis GTPase YqeH n=1 Tax=Aquibacillus koreensis TaxID=279446 RepID=A0A9X4AI75_9BACI|nr:ribosome biogenesis GTPase YqeH [Aquibacillus koreensis]MCT2537634.1 ribosome biogenesis GTPase YqeH [Aquibacillus koreensis]MDC3419080.1 ribosome biogenesis GTPase YqeH [Aquibacillus koreensis]